MKPSPTAQSSPLTHHHEPKLNTSSRALFIQTSHRKVVPSPAVLPICAAANRPLPPLSRLQPSLPLRRIEPVLAPLITSLSTPLNREPCHAKEPVLDFQTP
ncbi:hypothetical protein M0R45_008552 [Rubus argutus]|uniref:Uncharacterized protein n=1 Tax=Rubus argutus TaxID=59490 RepID=A0AAW1Y1X4_RUBAR